MTMRWLSHGCNIQRSNVESRVNLERAAMPILEQAAALSAPSDHKLSTTCEDCRF